MTAAAVLAVLVPLARADEKSGDAADVSVYRLQLFELEREIMRGILAPADAEAARAEVGRRLLRAANRERQAQAVRVWRRRAAMIAVVLFVPGAAVALYWFQGRPALPDAPLDERAMSFPNDLTGLLAQVEKRLAADPDDARGWRVVAPIYLQLGRAQDAAEAYRNAIRLEGEDPVLEAGLGESLTAVAGGIVTRRAWDAFQSAATGDPSAVKPRFYIALGLTQSGRNGEAITAWRELLKDARGDEPWAKVARAQLAKLTGQPAPAGAADAGVPAGGEPIAAMPPAERRAMIEQMVAGLDQRLKTQGGTIDEWLRLIRSYAVLGDTAQAKSAAALAKAAFPGDDVAAGRIDDAARSMDQPN